MSRATYEYLFWSQSGTISQQEATRQLNEMSMRGWRVLSSHQQQGGIRECLLERPRRKERRKTWLDRMRRAVRV